MGLRARLGPGLRASALAAFLGMGADAAAEGRDVFVCDFPRAGRVVIDTRPASTSITWDGVRYPAHSGSYFFQGTDAAPLVDGDPIVALFGPDFAWWDFRGERSRDCERRAAPPVRRVAAGAEDRRLEGMDYNLARRIVVEEYEWIPRQGACEGIGATEDACSAFPEIETCAGTGPGPCVMRFEKPGRCLILGTIGGPPDGEVDGEPAVRDVTFLERGCP